MLLTSRITSQLKDKIDALVNKGLYPDVNTFVVVALENQVVAEEERSPGGEKPMAAEALGAPEDAGTPQVVQTDKASVPSVRASSGRRLILPSRRASCFDWAGTPAAATKMVKDFPADRYAKGDRVGVERWLFGQQNRVVPLKVNARLFLATLADMDEEPRLSAVADAISSQAVLVGGEFERLDSDRGHKKSDALTTAFPAAQSDKSRQRFADQFVATENSQGELSGMLVDWKLATVERKKGKSFLYPTSACVTFANLVSPLLDGDTKAGVVDRFSEEELSWALQHVALNVHVESFAFSTLLRGIIAGAKDPTSLDRHLRDTGMVEHKKTSDDFVATQRAGAVSRMADLDMIRRIRDGVRVSYEVTSRGDSWLTAFSQN